MGILRNDAQNFRQKSGRLEEKYFTGNKCKLLQ